MGNLQKWIEWNKLAYFKAKPIGPINKWGFLRKKADKCSDKAKLS